MSIHERRERERARRHALILSTARELAERDGWEAVTTRRLAESIEYSQPVLYSHFRNREEIVREVALQGFRELAEAQRRARAEASGAADAVRRLSRVHHRFSVDHPRLYEAMFVHRVDLPFGTEEAPAELRDAFGELRVAVAGIAGGRDPDLLAEVLWASLHGLITLGRGRRLRPRQAEERLDMLIDGFLGAAASRV
jgi:AcrR family transcriptional regulator